MSNILTTKTPSVERGCINKTKLGHDYVAAAEKFAQRYEKRYGVYACPHCQDYHLTTALENAELYGGLLHVTKPPTDACSLYVTQAGKIYRRHSPGDAPPDADACVELLMGNGRLLRAIAGNVMWDDPDMDIRAWRMVRTSMSWKQLQAGFTKAMTAHLKATVPLSVRTDFQGWYPSLAELSREVKRCADQMLNALVSVEDADKARTFSAVLGCLSAKTWEMASAGIPPHEQVAPAPKRTIVPGESALTLHVSNMEAYPLFALWGILSEAAEIIADITLLNGDVLRDTTIKVEENMELVSPTEIAKVLQVRLGENLQPLEIANIRLIQVS